MSSAIQNVSGFSVARKFATVEKPQNVAALSSRMTSKLSSSPKFGAPVSKRALTMKVKAGDFDDPEYLARKAAAVAAQQAYKDATPNQPVAGGGPTHGGDHGAPAPTPTPTSFSPAPTPTPTSFRTPAPPVRQSASNPDADIDAEAAARRAKAIAAQQAYVSQTPNQPVAGGGPTHGGGHGAATPAPTPVPTPTPAAPVASFSSAPAPGEEETSEQRRARLIAANSVYKAVTPNEPIAGGGPTHGGGH